MCLARLLLNNYSVCLPFGDNERYDLVARRKDKPNFITIQCKTARLKDGCIYFDTCSRSGGDREDGRKDYKGDVDYFCVYCSLIDKCYMIKVGDCPSVGCSLRLESTKNNQTKGVRWAKDYLL